MPVTTDKPGPYAPASAIMSIVERHRNKGLPSVVDAETLARAGISDSLIPRTLHALNALDLIGDDGKPTQVLEGIRLAPEAEYQTRLAEWLNGAYEDALAYVDPATATESDVRDAFRTYKPIGQQSRMVSLFFGLYAAAGVVQERAKPAPRKSSNGTARPKPPAAKPAAASRRQAPLRSDGGASSDGGGRGMAGLPAPIAGLLASLPAEGDGWTKKKRDSFIATLGAVIDFVYPILSEAEAAAVSEPEADEDYDL